MLSEVELSLRICRGSAAIIGIILARLTSTFFLKQLLVSAQPLDIIL